MLKTWLAIFVENLAPRQPPLSKSLIKVGRPAYKSCNNFFLHLCDLAYIICNCFRFAKPLTVRELDDWAREKEDEWFKYDFMWSIGWSLVEFWNSYTFLRWNHGSLSNPKCLRTMQRTSGELIDHNYPVSMSLDLLFINYEYLPMLSKDIGLLLLYMELHWCYIVKGKIPWKPFLWKGLLDVITTCPWSIFLCSCICLTGENLPDHLTSLCIVWFLLSENIFNSTSVFEWTCVVHELFEKHFFEHISDYNHL